jgi:hypothetical protein
LVPKPKKALKSPAVHKCGRYPVVDVAVVIARSPLRRIPVDAHGDAQPLSDRRSV